MFLSNISATKLFFLINSAEHISTVNATFALFVYKYEEIFFTNRNLYSDLQCNDYVCKYVFIIHFTSYHNLF